MLGMLLLNVTTIVGCIITASLQVDQLTITANTLERVDFHLASSRKVCQSSHSFNPTRYKCNNNTLTLSVFEGYKETFEVRCFVKDTFYRGYVAISYSNIVRPNTPLIVICIVILCVLCYSSY
uniref:Nonstructural protein 4 n=1 Tax=Alphacoronavirus sp. TaxID=1906673 RepID=A0A8F0ZWL8_9ALPC|nr:nonstructural protein 4 [Alphacoronavirus sp.]